MDRTDLDAKLREVLPYVYFQPPASVAMSFPCIVYRNVGENVIYADNIRYSASMTYECVVVSRHPDEANDKATEICEKIAYSRRGRSYCLDGLTHVPITINT